MSDTSQPSIVNQNTKELSIVLVGHIDHGKSSLLGRLLLELEHIPKTAELAQRERAATRGMQFSYALLLDALAEEQNLGITIDVARAVISTSGKLIRVFDAPGHKEFLRNMVSGAARAELAVLVIDVAEGISPGTRLHIAVLELLGIKRVIVVVNKMDAVDYSQTAYAACSEKLIGLLAEYNLRPEFVIPASANNADNLLQPSSKTPWYDGPAILTALERCADAVTSRGEVLRLYVQDVYDRNNKVYTAGLLTEGRVEKGMALRALPSDEKVQVEEIYSWNDEAIDAVDAECSVALALNADTAITRGFLLCSESDTPPHHATVVRTRVLWLSQKPLTQLGEYHLRIGTAEYHVRCEQVEDIVDASLDNSRESDTQVAGGEIATCTFSSTTPLYFDEATLGTIASRFVLVDGHQIAGGGTFLPPMTKES